MAKLSSSIINSILYLLCGSCIGWLVGMSASESDVTPGVVSVLLGLMTTGALFFSKNLSSLVLFKAAILSSSIVIFSSVGMMARSNSSLIILGVGELRPPILFKNNDKSQTPPTGSPSKASQAALFTTLNSDCNELDHTSEDNLESRLEQYEDIRWKVVLKLPRSSRREAVKAICKK